MIDLTPYLPVVMLVVNLVIAWAIWSMRAAMRLELAALEARVRLAEQMIAAAPKQQDLVSMATAITAMKGDLGVVAEQVRGTRDLVARTEETIRTMHRHLLQQSPS
ncbi:MAG: hypothetical protein GC150_15425 [Rhizobiales bacterium]|nr:hypothetical protein [Hyphomicrobiales bacterium]